MSEQDDLCWWVEWYTGSIYPLFRVFYTSLGKTANDAEKWAAELKQDTNVKNVKIIPCVLKKGMVYPSKI